MADVPRRRQHHVGADVRAAVVRPQRSGRDGRDHLRTPDHRPAERVSAEDCLGREVVDEVLRVIVDHRDLLEHDLALAVDVVEGRCEHHVRHRVERALHVRVGHARVDDGRLARGRGVQLAAHRVEELGDLLRAVPLRALEEQVLDEVRDPGPRPWLVARPGADPESQRDRPHAAQRLAGDALAAGKGRDVGLAHGGDGIRGRGSKQVSHPTLVAIAMNHALRPHGYSRPLRAVHSFGDPS